VQPQRGPIERSQSLHPAPWALGTSVAVPHLSIPLTALHGRRGGVAPCRVWLTVRRLLLRPAQQAGIAVAADAAEDPARRPRGGTDSAPPSQPGLGNPDARLRLVSGIGELHVLAVELVHAASGDVVGSRHESILALGEPAICLYARLCHNPQEAHPVGCRENEVPSAEVGEGRTNSADRIVLQGEGRADT
jgi:hypothetical protein